MHGFMEDIHYAFRLFRKSPGFTLVVVLSLALGIGANTTTFTWLNNMVFKPLSGVPANDRLVLIENRTASGDENLVSYPDYRDYRDQSKTFAGLTGYNGLLLSLTSDNETNPVWAESVAGNFFDVLGVKAAVGRTFLPEEVSDQRGANPATVISYRLWKLRLHGDPGIVGRKVQLNRHPVTVVGVAPKDFHGAFVGVDWELWIPVTIRDGLIGSPDSSNRRDSHNLFVIGRLRPGVTAAAAGAEMDAISRQMARAYPETNAGVHAEAMPLWKAPYTAPSIMAAVCGILMAVSGVVLLIVCANVANLLLARATLRQKEFAIRVGLGAGRLRMIRQLLTEGLMLASGGAVLGVLLAYWMVDSLIMLVPATRFPLFVPNGLDANVLWFTVLMTVLAALLFGLAPALQATGGAVHESLKSGSRTVTASAKSQWLRKPLVVSEVALALITLIGAGLFLKSFENARKTDVGFDPQHVLLLGLNLGSSDYEAEEAKIFYRQLRQRIEALPGVQAVSYADSVPLGFEGGGSSTVEVEGYSPRAGETMDVYRTKAAPGYFAVMRIPLLEGRDFNERDDENSPPVAIVNQAFVQRFFQGHYAIGRHVMVSGRKVTVTGIVKTTKFRHIEESAEPGIYLAYRQFYFKSNQGVFHIRTTGPPMSIVEAARREIRARDPNVAIFGETSLVDYIGAALVVQKVAASLLSFMGTLSLVLAALGLYSVMAYSVTQRTHEIGIRMALGAQPGHVLRSVIGQAMLLSVLGVGLGLAAAFALTRLMSRLLFGVTAVDPATFVGAALFLSAIALLASYVPARRAMQLDPMASLREE